MSLAGFQQTVYQQRRSRQSMRMLFWIDKAVARAVDSLRGDETRQDWVTRAVILEVTRGLLGRDVPYSGAELVEAMKRARNL